jgi:DNA-directed RNA polymerase subunit RPC12/RpoP
MAVQHDTPTEADKHDDLRRQYAAFHVERTKGVTTQIFCPWCFKANKPGLAPCCPQFAEACTQIGKDQLAGVHRQLREVREGRRTAIDCPYCGTRVMRAEHPADWPRPMVSPFCCDLMHDAALAIAQRGAVEAATEAKKRIEDGL